jgi:putative ABC transport system permease protein
MKALRRFARRLTASVFRRREDDRFREELAEHSRLLIEDHVRAGLSFDEARRRALIELGVGDAIMEAHRDEQRLRWLEDLGTDLRYAFRTLRRTPGFTAVAILTLALGTGANLAIFALLNAVLIRPLPFRSPGELMLVHLLGPERESSEMLWSYPKYEVARDRQQVFIATALFTDREWTLTKTTQPERLQGEVVEASYFPLLGIDASLGRLFTAADDRVEATPVAMISHGLWQRRFGGQTDVLGKTIVLDGAALTIVGVTPARFRGLSGQADIWRPFKATVAGDLTEPFSHSYFQLARRRPGVSVGEAEAAVRGLGVLIDAAFPVTSAVGKSAVAVVPLNEERIDPLLRRATFVLLGAVCLVLLIACVNLANLTLARGFARQREVAVRLAIGASRLRIVRQLLTESLLLSVAGTAAGALVAAASVQFASSAMPDVNNLLRGETGGLMRVGASMLDVDATLVIAAVGLAMVTAVLFGIIPAWQAGRGDVAIPMKSALDSNRSTGARGFTLRNGLAVGEVALALVMLVCAGLMLTSLMRLSRTDLGFHPDDVVTFQIALPDESYTPRRSLQFVEELLTKLQARSEVEAAAFGHCAPITGPCNGTRASFPERPPVPPNRMPIVGVTWVSPDFFDTLGIRVVRGRRFTDHDRQGQPKVVVVNETAAKQLWPNEDPIGRRIGLGQGGFRDGAEVIGVVADVRYRAVETPPGPDVYIPVLQSPRSDGRVFVRSRVATSALVPMIRQELASLDRDLPLIDVKTMDERYGEATWQTWTISMLLSILAGLALLLALVGVFAVLAQSVAQRTREIGVRVALGAAPRDIRRLVWGRASTIAAVGVAIGLGATWFASRWLTAFLYEVEANDPTVLLAAAALLFCAALVAGYLPARRAAQVDPLQTIRSD